jgi:histidinol-phosphate aminotransferase
MFRVEKQVRPGIAGIQPYVPGLTDDELKHLYGLRRVIKLNANENALGPSPLAVEAIRQELNTLHHYPDGTSELLRTAIARFHQVQVESVFVGNGSDEIIKLLSETFLEAGDDIVVPFPSFSQYGFGAAIMGANVVSVPLDESFQYDLERFAQAITPRTKVMYLCSPNNPTGTYMRQEQVDWLLERLPQQVVLVLDLAYNDYSSNPNRVIETQSLLQSPRVVVLHTFSKLYGLAGLRVGYGLASPELWSFVNRVREPFNVNRVAQRAAAAALHDAQHADASRQHASDSRAFYERMAPELGFQVTPTEGNFVLMQTGNGVSMMKELMKQGVMVRAGFGGLEEHVRITFGTEEENEACIRALKTVHVG